MTKDEFVCCTMNKKIPMNQVCDDYDDCARDKSDQVLEACQKKTKGKLYCFSPSITRGNTKLTYRAIEITDSQLNDGKEHCKFGVDENCSWKVNSKVWVHPYKTKDFIDYFEFLKLLETKPTSSRWFTMATKEEIQHLGHNFKVRWSVSSLVLKKEKRKVTTIVCVFFTKSAN